jgi:hypothetical protein
MPRDLIFKSLVLLALFLFLPSLSLSCGDEICAINAEEGVLNSGNTPPSPNEAGFSAWVVLHTTVGYFPETLGESQKASLDAWVRFLLNLYPSPKGRKLLGAILQNKALMTLLSDAKTRDDAVFWCWLVHTLVNTNKESPTEVWPASLGIKARQFHNWQGLNTIPITFTSHQRGQIIEACNQRWVYQGGIENGDAIQAKKKDINLPPDRRMLGRSTWLLLHLAAAYNVGLTRPELNSVVDVVAAINDDYPCPLCRKHFQQVYRDVNFQRDLHSIRTSFDLGLFFWYMHNVVTADQYPERGIFPFNQADADWIPYSLPLPDFYIPAHVGHTPLRLDSFAHKDMKNSTYIDDYLRYRYTIVGGLDQDLHDVPPPVCVASPSDRRVSWKLFVMAKCPWCARAVVGLDKWGLFTCKLKCPDGSHIIPDFTLHWVGSRSESTGALTSMHGAGELVADKLEVCARKHYGHNYQYMKFVACMDLDHEKIPDNAADCAKKTGVDMKVLQKCSDEEGDTLLGTAFGYSSWKAVFSTPSVMLDKKMFRGVPMNITAGLSQLRRAISSWSNLLIFRCRIVRSSEVADFSCGRRSIEPEHDRHQFLR